VSSPSSRKRQTHHSALEIEAGIEATAVAEPGVVADMYTDESEIMSPIMSPDVVRRSGWRAGTRREMGTRRPWLPRIGSRGVVAAAAAAVGNVIGRGSPGRGGARGREEEGGRRHEPVGDGAQGNRRDVAEGERRSGGFTEK
jgi:hypothetical protein